MAEEFDLIEAFISVKIREESLNQVKKQIESITAPIKSLRASVGMRLAGKADFRKELREYLAGVKAGKVKVVPIIGNVSGFKKAIVDSAKAAAKDSVKIKIEADTKAAEAAIDKIIGKSATVSAVAKRATGSVDYLRLQVERWGRLNGRLEESRRLLGEIERPGFGSWADMEDIRSQMSYYDRLQNQASRIADLSSTVSEWGKLPGRLQKSQELLARIGKEGFGSQRDFKAITREMRAVDNVLANESRKASARAYVNEWGRLSGKLKEASNLIELIGQQEIFGKEDFSAIRQITKELDKAAAAAARVDAQLAKASKQLKIVAQPQPGKFNFKTNFVRLESVEGEAVKANKEAQRRAARLRSAARGAFFEAGFVAGPATAIIGNLIGVNNQVQSFVNNSDRAKKVADRFGISVGALGKYAGKAAALLTLAVGSVAKLLSMSYGMVTQFSQQGIGGLTEGFKAVIGPALALFQAIRGIASYLPLVAAGIAGFVGETLTKATVEFDKIQSLFKFTFADQAASQLNLVRQVSDSFGLSLDALAVGYGKLAAAAKDSGITQEEIRQLFIGTSSAAAAFKLNQGDLDGVFRAYQQIISKSVVSSEELRQQLSERLPAAFALAAKSLGKSQQDLNEALANGSVTAEEFIPAFGRALRQAYDQDASGIVDSLPAKLNRLENSLLDLQRSAEGTGFLEAFVDLKQGLIEPFIKEGAIKDALKNVFVEAGKAFRFFTAQIPLAIELLKNVWRAVRPLVEAFATLQLVFSAIAIAAAKELVQVDRVTEATFGRSVKTIREFSQRVTQALNLDLGDFRSVMAFVDAIIRRSDLALAAFTITLQAAIKSILIFATTLFVSLLPVMVDLGMQLGKAIARGILNGLSANSERNDIQRRLADVQELISEGYTFKGGFGFTSKRVPITDPMVISGLKKQRRDLEKQLRDIDESETPQGLGKRIFVSLENSLTAAAEEFKNNPDLLGILATIGGVVQESKKRLLPVAEEKRTDLSFLGIPLTQPRNALAAATQAADFESQFFGFEEFQRFLQSGTNEQVRVAENTQKIYEISQQQLDVLNKLNMSQQATNNLLIGEGAYMLAPSTLRWEN